jgi:hypothetical protein
VEWPWPDIKGIEVSSVSFDVLKGIYDRDILSRKRVSLIRQKLRIPIFPRGH